MIRSSGQRLHCVRFLCLCALCLGASCAREAWLSSVMSRCVGVGFLACARHAQHFALQNGSIGPKLLNSPAARPHKKGLFIAKGEGAPGKGGFLSTFFGFCGVFHCSRCFWCTYWEHDCSIGRCWQLKPCLAAIAAVRQGRRRRGRDRLGTVWRLGRRRRTRGGRRIDWGYCTEGIGLGGDHRVCQVDPKRLILLLALPAVERGRPSYSMPQAS